MRYAASENMPTGTRTTWFTDGVLHGGNILAGKRKGQDVSLTGKLFVSSLQVVNVTTSLVIGNRLSSTKTSLCFSQGHASWLSGKGTGATMNGTFMLS